jgi:hypothetical protein
MIEIIFLIALYIFIVGFEAESMGLFDEWYCLTTGNKTTIVLFCMTVGIISFPFRLGVKVSRFLDRE